MQILLFSLVVLILAIYIIYKINQNFSKSAILKGVGIVVAFIGAIIFFNSYQNNKFPNAFKEHYKKEKNLDILKLSSTELLKDNTMGAKDKKYSFAYIVQKDGSEYICEANKVYIQVIEDEYIFKDYKENCRKK